MALKNRLYFCKAKNDFSFLSLDFRVKDITVANTENTVLLSVNKGGVVVLKPNTSSRKMKLLDT